MGWSKEGSYVKLKYPWVVMIRGTGVTTHVNAAYQGPSNFVCDIRRGVERVARLQPLARRVRQPFESAGSAGHMPKERETRIVLYYSRAVRDITLP